MGFLTFQRSEILVPLDGQHRAKAFKFAIDGSDDNNRPIEGIRSNQELAKDQVSIILVRFEPVSSRRIFNKLNRYTKATTKSDNLITDDDDSLAVITRNLLGENGLIPARLVRLGANTLNARAPEFTTIATFYNCNKVIAESLRLVGGGELEQLEVAQRDLVEESVRKIWDLLLTGIDCWAQSLEDPTERGDATRIRIREETLLGKPIGQFALVRGYLVMRERCLDIDTDEICNRLNCIDWGVKNSMWHNVLMKSNGRVMSGKNTVNRACEFIAHLGGAKLTAEETNRLLNHIHGDDWENHTLPEPVV